LTRLKRDIVGLAQDYWKDGDWGKSQGTPSLIKVKGGSNGAAQVVAPRPMVRLDLEKPTGEWHALPGEISERIWGKGFVTPGDEYISDLLLKPLGINKDMNILDLSAGLGGRLRRATDEYGAYIDGFEPDPEIAARGMDMSVAKGKGRHVKVQHYDPMNLSLTHHYDCVILRETIYRVADKQKFVKSIIDNCKPHAQFSFTDYIVNPEARGRPAIAVWLAFEKGANPVGLVEMAELWAKNGVVLRVHDDQTDYYKKEIKDGLEIFAKFIASGIKPDEVTKKAIQKRITTWGCRLAAIEQGMKFYRFYGLK
jgi:SAM-dependent methyltransferase